MIRLMAQAPTDITHAHQMLQTALEVEFSTLPIYLYALYTIRPDTNPEAAARIKAIALEEMTHMCLACNILNALGGDPKIVPPTYPGPLPGDIGPDGTPLTVHLYPFSPQAMWQGMEIEKPADAPEFPVKALLAAAAPGPRAVTIGQFYEMLDAYLATLPPDAWTPDRNQITDDQFFVGQIFAVNNYADAHKAIEWIISEGEGAQDNPLDFEDEVAHYYRFGEVFHDRVLTKSDNPTGYQWGPDRLGIDYATAYPAITDPCSYDFSGEPADVQAAQKACNDAYTAMVDALQDAVSGQEGALGQAARAMFDLRMAAKHAVTVPLRDGMVAGPAFLYQNA